MVEYHEWHLHEPLLQNYEGWRILDNPKYEKKSDAYVYDITGCVRHLDPIIDDPRLTHKQRVCRLYRWALKELQMWLVQLNAHKFNLAYKVVRRRFEEYRYVTDPAACDEMVRQTQKYLRDNANFHYMRRNNSSPWSTYTLANPMFHPDNALVYDHWTHPEVMWYDDAKLHRWTSHHPMYAGAGEFSERYGDMDVAPHLRWFVWTWFGCIGLWCLAHVYGVFHYEEDPHYAAWNQSLEQTHLRASNESAAGGEEEGGQSMLFAVEERSSRPRGSVLGFDWDRIMGQKVNTQKGVHYYDNAWVQLNEKSSGSTGV